MNISKMILIDFPNLTEQEAKEILNMLRAGVKLELEALSKKDISFASDEFLPKKIKDKDWLD